MRASVHALHVGQQLRAAVQQFVLVAPVERVGRHKIRDAHAIARDELPPLHVFLQHGCHIFELAAGEDHVAGQALFFRIERRVARDAPQRLLQLRRREQ